MTLVGELGAQVLLMKSSMPPPTCTACHQTLCPDTSRQRSNTATTKMLLKQAGKGNRDARRKKCTGAKGGRGRQTGGGKAGRGNSGEGKQGEGKMRQAPNGREEGKDVEQVRCQSKQDSRHI